MKPDLSTPIIYLDRTGWVPHLLPDKTVEWGHRFDPGIGYRVFLKYTDSEQINAFPPAFARVLADKIKRGGVQVYKDLAKAMHDTADAADKMNKLWANAGAPDVPVDQIGQAGNG